MIGILQCGLRPKPEQLLPIQPGDVPATYADITRARTKLGFQPLTPIDVGIPRFVRWYFDYYRLRRRSYRSRNILHKFSGDYSLPLDGGGLGWG